MRGSIFLLLLTLLLVGKPLYGVASVAAEISLQTSDGAPKP